MDMRQIPGVLNRAGVSKSDLSRITGFSRISINRWIDKGVEPRRQVDAALVTGVLDAIDRATQEGELPLPEAISVAERRSRLRNTIRSRIDIEMIERFIA